MADNYRSNNQSSTGIPIVWGREREALGSLSRVSGWGAMGRAWAADQSTIQTTIRSTIKKGMVRTKQDYSRWKQKQEVWMGVWVLNDYTILALVAFRFSGVGRALRFPLIWLGTSVPSLPVRSKTVQVGCWGRSGTKLYTGLPGAKQHYSG